MLTIDNSKQEGYKKLINILSVAIPLAVAVLLGLRTKVYLGEWTKLLPHVNGMINSLTAVLLLIGFFAIRNKNISLHRSMMLAAFSLGSLFLVTYILYHFSNESTSYGGTGIDKPVYYFFLISHILLSAVVVRFVLLAVFYALSNQIDAHKRIVKWTLPIWLYVSVSGVIVYLMISQYYH